MISGGQVSIHGGNGHEYTLHFDTENQFNLAKTLASQINARIGKVNFISPPENQTPTLKPGQIGEFVATQDGSWKMPVGYDAIIDVAANATIMGSGGNHQTIMAGISNLSFFAAEGSGTVVAGSGNDSIGLAESNAGNWKISLGNGNDTIDALGHGSHIIDIGSGNSFIRLDGGRDTVQVAGDATVQAGSDTATIFGGPLGFHFIGGAGQALVTGGTQGGNVFQAGQGNETLIGAAPVGLHDSSIHGSDAFVFVNHAAGGDDIIKNFAGSDQVFLQGYSTNEVANALAGAKTNSHGTTITLSDKTSITFADVYHLDQKSFILKI